MSEKSTRANVPAPPRKNFLPDPVSTAVAPVQAANNMKGARIAPMTFNMPKEWHTRFKMTAVSLGIDMKQLLIRSFDAFEREERSKLK